MEWLVSAGLLVAVAAWVAGVSHRLQMLRGKMRRAWADWLEETHRRNEALGKWTEAVSVLLPPGEMLPRTLRRLLSDSELDLRAGAVRMDTEGELKRKALTIAMSLSVPLPTPSDTGLPKLCEALRLCLEAQERRALQFRAAAEAYHTALQEPPIRLIAAALGFQREEQGLPER